MGSNSKTKLSSTYLTIVCLLVAYTNVRANR